MKKLVCILIWVLLSVANFIYAQSDNDNPTDKDPEVWIYPPIKRTVVPEEVQFVESGECICILIRNLSGKAVIEYTGSLGNPECLEIRLSGKETTITLSKSAILPGTRIRITVRR